MPITEPKLDALESATFHGRLRDIETSPDRFDFPDMPFADGKLVYIDFQNKPEFKKSVWYQITKQGSFKLIRNYTTTIPRVNVLVNEKEQDIHKWGSSYDYSDDDMLAVMRMGYSIDTEKIRAVREAYRQELNDLIAYGDPDLGMPGFINHPDALRTKSPFDLDATSLPSQKLGVLNDLANSIPLLTNNVEKPDTLLIPLSRYNKCVNELISTPDGLIDKTVLRHFLETNPYIKQVQPLIELEASQLQAAGVSEKPLAIAYCRNKSKVKAKVYQPLTFLEPRREGLDTWVKPAKFKYGGIQFRRAWSCHVMELPNAA